MKINASYACGCCRRAISQQSEPRNEAVYCVSRANSVFDRTCWRSASHILLAAVKFLPMDRAALERLGKEARTAVDLHDK